MSRVRGDRGHTDVVRHTMLLSACPGATRGKATPRRPESTWRRSQDGYSRKITLARRASVHTSPFPTTAVLLLLAGHHTVRYSSGAAYSRFRMNGPIFRATRTPMAINGGTRGSFFQPITWDLTTISASGTIALMSSTTPHCTAVTLAAGTAGSDGKERRPIAC